MMKFKKAHVAKVLPLLAGVASLSLAVGTILPALSQFPQSPIPTSAQPDDRQAAQRSGDRPGFEKALNLTDAQKAELKTIRDSARQQMEEVFTADQKTQMQQARQQRQRPNLTLSAEQKSKLESIRRDTKIKIDAVLTPGQKQKPQQTRPQRQPDRLGIGINPDSIA
jgi:periplasmic protein CpxP/Spy